ncbi:glycosyltransferase [Bacillus sp. EB600]|uniref:glycosyltransferase n=1 Tax=Bacillus sp. EB600 TaxID=2806345 RepID=UPI00210B8A52|nr:glycosyltransferase [Bacillus sp. EB600]MCQ6280423.1 glycosyltransferase [Bacillus sp. EB600]
MLNLLLIGKDTKNNTFNESVYHVEKELSQKTNLAIWRDSGQIKDILKQIPFTPDFILIQNDIGGSLKPVVNGLSEIKIPAGIFIEDVHRFINRRREYIKSNNIQYIFPNYKRIFFKIYPEFKSRFCWFPHHINSEIFKDYGLPKEIDMLLMGAVNGGYPLREKIVKQFKKDPRFVYHRHPGYRKYTEEEKTQIFVNEKYAMEINRAKIFFTCGTARKFPVMKYFEVPGCRTLLLAPQLKDLDDLGFIPGEHYVRITKDDFYKKAEYYLKHEDERNRIADQGYQFVQTQHTTKKRVEQLITKIEEILGKHIESPDL